MDANICVYDYDFYRVEKHGNTYRLRRITRREAEKLRLGIENIDKYPKCLELILGMSGVETLNDLMRKSISSIHLDIAALKSRELYIDGKKMRLVDENGREWNGELLHDELPGACIFKPGTRSDIKHADIYLLEDKCVALLEHSYGRTVNNVYILVGDRVR